MSLFAVEPSHYPTPAERSADGWVHLIGVAAAGVGALALLALSLERGRLSDAPAIIVYAACLMAMFGCSAAYNMAGARHRTVLRRLDHAAIFLMIAGSYTPFTTLRLTGAWAVGMTAAVWSLALAGMAAKLFLPDMGRGYWVGIYLGLGWLVVVAIKPLSAVVSMPALALLAAGGLIYSLGVIVYVRESLRFRRAIWHGFVLAAAAVQYAAVLLGVVLSTRG